MWWYSKEGGKWKPVEKIGNAPIPKLNVWYRMKFIVEGQKFTCLMAKRGEEFDEAKHLVGTWKHKAFKKGAIGFRESGTEHSRYDNVLVTTIGYKMAVSPVGHLTTTWGKIKTGH